MNESMLQGLVKEAFAGGAADPAPTPKPPTRVKIASGPTSTAFLKKVSLALHHAASGIAKQAQIPDDSYGDTPVGAVENSADRYVTDEMGDLDLSTSQIAYSPPGQDGEVPTGPSANPNLGGWSPENNAEATPGFESPGQTDYDIEGNLMSLSAAGTPKRDLTPTERVKQAQARVLSRVQGALLQHKQAQDALPAVVPPTTAGAVGGSNVNLPIMQNRPAPEARPPMERPTTPAAWLGHELKAKQATEDPTIVPNLGGDGGGTGDPGSFEEGLPAKANIPQSTESVISLTNTEADAANKAELEAALGPAAVAASDADKTQEQVLEHASGDEIPTDKQASLRDILRHTSLSRIVGGG